MSRNNALSALKAELIKKKQTFKTSDHSNSLSDDINNQIDTLRKATSSKAALFKDFHTKSTVAKTPLELAREARKNAKYEEELTLISSRESLERKAKIYNEKLMQMTRALTQGQQCDTLGESTNEADESVIDFQAKAIDMLRNPQDYHDVPDETSPSVSPQCSDVDEGDDDRPESGWTEYVDAFGRTRKCLKSELPHLKRLDREISKTDEHNDKTTITDTSDQPRGAGVEVPPPGYSGNLSTKPSGSSKQIESKLATGDYKRPGYDKDFVRYRDILGDEVRDHGVGYFAFSSDEAKRKSQLDYLASMRQDTSAQKKPKTS